MISYYLMLAILIISYLLYNKALHLLVIEFYKSSSARTSHRCHLISQRIHPRSCSYRIDRAHRSDEALCLALDCTCLPATAQGHPGSCSPPLYHRLKFITLKKLSHLRLIYRMTLQYSRIWFKTSK